jgi:hypothetical protein
MHLTVSDFDRLFGPGVNNEEQQRLLREQKRDIEAKIYLLTLQKTIQDFGAWLKDQTIKTYPRNPRSQVFKNNVEDYFKCKLKNDNIQDNPCGSILQPIVQVGFDNENLLRFIFMSMFLNKAYVEGIVKHNLTEVFYIPFDRMAKDFEIEEELLKHSVSQIQEWCPAELGEIRSESQFSKSRTLS